MSIHIQQLTTLWTDFNNILHLKIFLNLLRKYQVPLNSEMNNA